MARFKLDWEAGPSAQIELFSPDGKGSDVYQLKYTSPFHPTIRPPLERRPLGPEDLSPVSEELDKLVPRLERGDRPRARDSSGNDEALAPAEDLEWIGQQLLDLLIPPYIQADLRGGGMFLEIGMDEQLLAYPWELMHDGHQFLSLKHAMGRFVNAGRGMLAAQGRLPNMPGATLDKLSVLVISVPNPEGSNYEQLPEVEAETKSIVATIGESDWADVDLLRGKEATYRKVSDALRSGKYHIVHYNGHAVFDDRNPNRSALVLQNKVMTTGQIQTFFGNHPAILCFINGCETARATATLKKRHDVFGLGRAFLETGSYLLGSRWKLPDMAAASFSKVFYSSLIQEFCPIGEAVRRARLACQEAGAGDDCAWASYVYYGDPRLCFRRVAHQAGGAGSEG